MAEQVTGHRFPRKYPWDQWANGEQWKVKQGEDYFCPSKSFRGAAWQHARKSGKRLNTHIHRDDTGEYMIFQFDPPE